MSKKDQLVRTPQASALTHKDPRRDEWKGPESKKMLLLPCMMIYSRLSMIRSDFGSHSFVSPINNITTPLKYQGPCRARLKLSRVTRIDLNFLKSQIKMLVSQLSHVHESMDDNNLRNMQAK